jgi:hypothetical protein
MNAAIHRRVDAPSKNVLIFNILMLVGVMVYSGELGYTPVVLLVLLMMAVIGKYGSK